MSFCPCRHRNHHQRRVLWPSQLNGMCALSLLLLLFAYMPAVFIYGFRSICTWAAAQTRKYRARFTDIRSNCVSFADMWTHHLGCPPPPCPLPPLFAHSSLFTGKYHWANVRATNCICLAHKSYMLNFHHFHSKQTNPFPPHLLNPLLLDVLSAGAVEFWFVVILFLFFFPSSIEFINRAHVLGIWPPLPPSTS